MNTRRSSWLLMAGILLAFSVDLLAQAPAPGAQPSIQVQQPTGTYFFSDLNTPPAQAQLTTPAPQPAPVTPAVEQAPVENAPAPGNAFFFSDLQAPQDTPVTNPSFAPSPNDNLFLTETLPPIPSPNQTGTHRAGTLLPTTPLVVERPSSIMQLTPRADTPTTLAPMPTFTLPNYAMPASDQPASFTNLEALLPEDPTASPNDESMTPAQKGCSKWCRTVHLWGEFLYLRSRDSEVTYGVETNSAVAPPAPPVQVGRVGMVDQTADPGFRFGITYALDEESSLTGSWAMLESHRTDRIDRTSLTNVIESSVLHPTTAAASSSGTFATGIHDIDFDLVDLEYRGRLSSSEVMETNFVAGLRYVYLQQEFLHNTNILGNQSVATDIDFNGLGVRLGLEGERFRHKSRWFFYGKTYVNFVAGEFNAKYDQGQAFDASVVDTLWEAGRIVSIWDLELGFGHVCKSERLSISAGYLFSAWTNVVKTDEFIHAVQTNNFLNLGETMTYDGLVARVECRF